jgi:hypothetical protein
VKDVKNIHQNFTICWISLSWVSTCWDREYYRGMYYYTVDLLFDWFGISCMTTDNFCFCLQNRLIQTSQTGGQWYSDTSLFSIPCLGLKILTDIMPSVMAPCKEYILVLAIEQWPQRNELWTQQDLPLEPIPFPRLENV